MLLESSSTAGSQLEGMSQNLPDITMILTAVFSQANHIKQGKRKAYNFCQLFFVF